MEAYPNPLEPQGPADDAWTGEQPLEPAPAPDLSGARLAAILMVVNTMLVFLDWAVAQGMVGVESGGLFDGPPVLSVVLDLVLGWFLFKGDMRVKPWVLVRVVIGAVLFTSLRLSQADYVTTAAQIFLSASIFFALVGHASLVRRRVAVVLYMPPLLFALLGYYAVFSGTAPLAALSFQMSGDLKTGTITEVVGLETPWRIEVTRGGWYERTATSVARDDPGADRWITQPNIGANVVVVVESLTDEGTGELFFLDMQNYRDVVLEDLGVGVGATLQDEEELPDGSRWLEVAVDSPEGIPMVQVMRLVVVRTHAYQLVGYVSAENYPRVANELRTMLESFRAP